MRRDSALLKAALLRISTNALALAGHVEDLDLIAYESTNTSDGPKVRNTRTDYALDDVGAEHAKKVLAELDRVMCRDRYVTSTDLAAATDRRHRIPSMDDA